MKHFHSQAALDNHKVCHQTEDDDYREFGTRTKSVSAAKSTLSSWPKKTYLPKRILEEPQKVPKKELEEPPQISIPECTSKPEEPLSPTPVNRVPEKFLTAFKCETCNVFFHSADEAKVHGASKKCKYSCRMCNRKFNTLYAFVVHVMQHKSITENKGTKSAYSCNNCTRSFEDCFNLNGT